jgi:hypothetical protein
MEPLKHGASRTTRERRAKEKLHGVIEGAVPRPMKLASDFRKQVVGKPALRQFA